MMCIKIRDMNEKEKKDYLKSKEVMELVQEETLAAKILFTDNISDGSLSIYETKDCSKIVITDEEEYAENNKLYTTIDSGNRVLCEQIEICSKDKDSGNLNSCVLKNGKEKKMGWGSSDACAAAESDIRKCKLKQIILSIEGYAELLLRKYKEKGEYPNYVLEIKQLCEKAIRGGT